jgi:hypothetical protein
VPRRDRLARDLLKADVTVTGFGAETLVGSRTPDAGGALAGMVSDLRSEVDGAGLEPSDHLREFADGSAADPDRGAVVERDAHEVLEGQNRIAARRAGNSLRGKAHEVLASSFEKSRSPSRFVG